MSAVFNMVGGGGGSSEGVNVNGRIDRVTVAEDNAIEPGDYVEIDVSVGDNLTVPAISGTIYGANIYNLKAIPLNDTQILVLYSGSSTPVYANILTLTENAGTYGTEVIVTETKVHYDLGRLQAVKVGENKVLLLWQAASGYAKSGVVLTVNGSEISVGTETIINADGLNTKILAEKMTEEKILVAYAGSGTKAHILTVSGDTITAGELQSVWTRNASFALKTSEEKVMVFYNSYYMPIQIAGDIMTAGAELNTGSRSLTAAKLKGKNQIVWVEGTSTGLLIGCGRIIGDSIEIPLSTVNKYLYIHRKSVGGYLDLYKLADMGGYFAVLGESQESSGSYKYFGRYVVDVNGKTPYLVASITGGSAYNLKTQDLVYVKGKLMLFSNVSTTGDCKKISKTVGGVQCVASGVAKTGGTAGEEIEVYLA